MATEAFSREDITLLDGTEVELRPLAIYSMRKFMKIWSECVVKVQERYAEASKDPEQFSPAAVQGETTEWQYDAWIPMCALALEEELKGERSDKQFKDYLEKTLDEASIYKILAVCGNLKLGPETPNPNPAVTNPE